MRGGSGLLIVSKRARIRQGFTVGGRRVPSSDGGGMRLRMARRGRSRLRWWRWINSSLIAVQTGPFGIRMIRIPVHFRAWYLSARVQAMRLRRERFHGREFQKSPGELNASARSANREQAERQAHHWLGSAWAWAVNQDAGCGTLIKRGEERGNAGKAKSERGRASVRRSNDDGGATRASLTMGPGNVWGQ